MENIEATFNLIPEFRAQREILMEGDDVLQLCSMLWYAWSHLATMWSIVDDCLAAPVDGNHPGDVQDSYEVCLF